MKLYEISQNINSGYDTYDSAIADNRFFMAVSIEIDNDLQTEPEWANKSFKERGGGIETCVLCDGIESFEVTVDMTVEEAPIIV